MPHHRILEWQHLTGRQIDAVDRRKAVVTVTISPLEVHGPHLPVITDSCEGEGLLRRIMEMLCERHEDLTFLHLPPIYTAADVLPHPGSIMFRQSTIRATVEDLGRSLVKQGFRRLWISNFHGGLRHFVTIEQACHNVNRRYGGETLCAFSLLLSILTGGGTDLSDVLGHISGLTPEDLIGDSHGGAVETSVMLHLLGQHVDPVYRGLPQRTVSLKLEEQGKPPLAENVRGHRASLLELFRGFREKLKYYEDETYSGKPALGDPERGRLIVEELARRSADALSDVWTGGRSPDDCHSPLWKVRWAFTNEWVGRAFERAVGFRQRVF